METIAQAAEFVRPTAPAAIQPYKRFANRIHQPRGEPSWELGNAQNAMIANDLAIKRYFKDLGSRRNNNGIVSAASIQFTYQSVKQFLAHIDVEVSDHAISDLVNYKRQNPLSDDIELALAD